LSITYQGESLPDFTSLDGAIAKRCCKQFAWLNETL